MPASVVYTFPVDPIQTDDGPEIAGTGSALTVTVAVPAITAEHAGAVW
jgi:hypothetical protein